MKRTTFKDIDLQVSITFDQVCMDTLLANEIEYTIRDIPIFQTLLPPDIIAYNGYEVIYTDENEETRYVYPFVTITYDSTKCVTFFADHQLDNVYLLDLEQALRLDRLVFETIEGTEEEFAGFDFSGEINLEQLVGSTLYLKDGISYQFTTMNAFPEGIYAKKILKDGSAVNVILTKIDGSEVLYGLNEEGSGWKLFTKTELEKLFTE